MSEQEQAKIFAKNLNNLLASRNKMQLEVAEAIGVSQQAFSTWCTGRNLPRMGKIQRLADYFGVQKSDLLEDKSHEDEHYYIDDAAREYARFLHDNPEYGVLFDASRKIKAEDIDIVRQLLDKFKEAEE